jgi:hypothetical protein
MIVTAITILGTSVAAFKENTRIRIDFRKVDNEVMNLTAVTQGLQQWQIIALTVLILKVLSPMALLDS